jgi:subtilisin family serine protease
MKRVLSISISVVFLALAVGLQGAPAANGRAQSKPGQVDSTSLIVQLQLDPLSTDAKTKPLSGKKIDFNSATVKSQRALLSAQRNAFKTWLRANAPAVKVTGEFDIALNAVSVELNGVDIEVIRKAPQVKAANYQMLYSPNTSDPDLGLIHAIEAWQVGGGAADAGSGVRVAIVDTGIDIRHPCFSDAGYPAANQLGDHRFTNNKVIAARVFNNKAANQGSTAEAVQDHGTHVAGTVACNYNTPAIVNGAAIPYGVSGVAPRAMLGNYNVFPGAVSNARSEDILNALEAAYADGFDIANLSLGSRPPSGNLGFQDLLAVGINNLDVANMVVAVAAGNNGPGYGTVESPGSAARALTAGASSVPHYPGTMVTVGGQTYIARAGDFGLVFSNLTAPLSVVADGAALSEGCSSLAAGSLAGKIALLARGTCGFTPKILNAQNAGAVAALVVNNEPGDPIEMAQDGSVPQPTIPALMLSQSDGNAAMALFGQPVTISSTQAYYLSANSDLMGDFSGQGPTDVDARIKPDVVAPGINVLSSIPLSFCGGSPCWTFLDGTSMATPHLAGSAAIMRWLYPNWSAAEIRSAIVNTADRHVLKNYATTLPETDVNITGSGRENLLAAVNAMVALDPVSVTFGQVPSGSGQVRTTSLSLRNLSTASVPCSLHVGPGDASVAYTISPASISLKPGQTATATLTMSAARGAVAGGHQAFLTIATGTNEIAHAAVYMLVK